MEVKKHYEPEIVLHNSFNTVTSTEEYYIYSIDDLFSMHARTGAIIAALVVILAVIVISVNLPPGKNQLQMTVKSLSVDHADEIIAGHPDQTSYIFDISISYNGSGSIQLNPASFYIVTSNGTYQADTSGFFSYVSNPLNPVSLSNGQTASGQIYDAFTSGIAISTVYYKYSGTTYSSNVPAASAWVSYVEGVNVSNSDSSVFVDSFSFPGDVVSGNYFTVNVSFSNDHSFYSVNVTSITANTPFSVVSVKPAIGSSIAAGNQVYYDVKVKPPSQSYYGYLDLIVSDST